MKLSKRVSVCLRRPWISRADLWEALESYEHDATAEQMRLLGPVLAFRHHWARPFVELGLISLFTAIDLVASLFPRRRASGVGFVLIRWSLWDVVIDDHNVSWRDAEAKPAVCVPLPADVVRFNGGVRCDVSYGPCACGATHLPVSPPSERNWLTQAELEQLAVDDDYPPVDSFAWSNWPSDRPRPTRGEWKAAKERWRATRHPEDFTDGSLDFTFLLATYARMCWWQFFFPEEPAPPPGFEPS